MTDICIHKNEKYSVSWAMVSEHNVWLANGFQPIVDHCVYETIKSSDCWITYTFVFTTNYTYLSDISVDPAGSAP